MLGESGFRKKHNAQTTKLKSAEVSKCLTCSTPSMCASISWMTLASLSASSAERLPLLIFSASRLMSLWASSKYGWSGWSSGVCLSKSLNKQQHIHLRLSGLSITKQSELLSQQAHSSIFKSLTLTSSSYRGILCTGLIIRSPRACFSLFSRMFCC